MSRKDSFKTIVAAIAALTCVASSAFATGACCDGAICSEVTEAECVSGVWLGELTTCGPDCDSDGTVDACAIAQGTSNDCNADGLPDECLIFATAQLEPDPYRANRTITFGNATASESMGIEVRFVDLPAQHSVLNGYSMWVGEPFQVSENGASREPNIPGFPNFWAAQLQCEPVFLDWTTYDDLRINGADIVPSAIYEIRAIPAVCAAGDPANYSAPLVVYTAQWADLVGAFDLDTQTWDWPDGSIDVATDVVAQLDKFSSKPTSPPKARMELEPQLSDWKIGISDVTVILDAFGGGGFPFAPRDATPCP